MPSGWQTCCAMGFYGPDSLKFSDPTPVEFRKFLDSIETSMPAGMDVHLILDNYGTHKTVMIRRWLAKRPHYHVHFTPTGASWINLVERFFALLTEKQIRRAVHRSTRELEQAIRHYLHTYNETAKPFVWTKTADQNPRQCGQILSANFSYSTLVLLCYK